MTGTVGYSIHATTQLSLWANEIYVACFQMVLRKLLHARMFPDYFFKKASASAGVALAAGGASRLHWLAAKS